MDSQEKFNQALEIRVEKIEHKLDGSMEILGQMNEKLKLLEKIELGLFGDEKMGYSGVMKTQTNLQLQIDTLKQEIIDIKQVNSDQSVAIAAKKSIRSDVTNIGKYIIQAIINMLLFYGIWKGLIGPDALIK